MFINLCFLLCFFISVQSETYYLIHGKLYPSLKVFNLVYKPQKNFNPFVTQEEEKASPTTTSAITTRAITTATTSTTTDIPDTSTTETIPTTITLVPTTTCGNCSDNCIIPQYRCKFDNQCPPCYICSADLNYIYKICKHVAYNLTTTTSAITATTQFLDTSTTTKNVDYTASTISSPSTDNPINTDVENITESSTSSESTVLTTEAKLETKQNEDKTIPRVLAGLAKTIALVITDFDRLLNFDSTTSTRSKDITTTTTTNSRLITNNDFSTTTTAVVSQQQTKTVNLSTDSTIDSFEETKSITVTLGDSSTSSNLWIISSKTDLETASTTITNTYSSSSSTSSRSIIPETSTTLKIDNLGEETSGSGSGDLDDDDENYSFTQKLSSSDSTTRAIISTNLQSEELNSTAKTSTVTTAPTKITTQKIKKTSTSTSTATLKIESPDKEGSDFEFEDDEKNDTNKQKLTTIVSSDSTTRAISPTNLESEKLNSTTKTSTVTAAPTKITTQKIKKTSTSTSTATLKIESPDKEGSDFEFEDDEKNDTNKQKLTTIVSSDRTTRAIIPANLESEEPNSTTKTSTVTTAPTKITTQKIKKTSPSTSVATLKIESPDEDGFSFEFKDDEENETNNQKLSTIVSSDSTTKAIIPTNLQSEEPNSTTRTSTVSAAPTKITTPKIRKTSPSTSVSTLKIESLDKDGSGFEFKDDEEDDTNNQKLTTLVSSDSTTRAIIPTNLQSEEPNSTTKTSTVPAAPTKTTTPKIGKTSLSTSTATLKIESPDEDGSGFEFKDDEEDETNNQKLTTLVSSDSTTRATIPTNLQSEELNSTTTPDIKVEKIDKTSPSITLITESSSEEASGFGSSYDDEDSIIIQEPSNSINHDNGSGFIDPSDDIIFPNIDSKPFTSKKTYKQSRDFIFVDKKSEENFDVKKRKISSDKSNLLNLISGNTKTDNQVLTTTDLPQTQTEEVKDFIEKPNKSILFNVIPDSILKTNRNAILDEDYFLIVDGFANPPSDKNVKVNSTLSEKNKKFIS